MTKSFYAVRKSTYRLVSDYYIVAACDPDEAVNIAIDTGAKLANEMEYWELNSKYDTVKLSDQQAKSFWETSIKANEFFT